MSLPSKVGGPYSKVGEGNGNPLQYSCLENPMDGGAWWAIVHGVAESDTTEQLHSLNSKVSSHFLFANKAFEHRVLLQDTNYMFKLLRAGGPGSSLAALSPIYLPPQLFSPSDVTTGGEAVMTPEGQLRETPTAEGVPYASHSTTNSTELSWTCTSRGPAARPLAGVLQCKFPLAPSQRGMHRASAGSLCSSGL